MKTIIRVEHTDGWGMFINFSHRACVDEFLPSLCDRHRDFNSPKQDGLHREDSHYCAYKSIEHLQAWIKADEFKILFYHGFKVYLLDVRDWQEGKDNILFKKEDITNKKDISELFMQSNDK